MPTSVTLLLAIMFYGVAAYLMWGLFPGFFPLLRPATPVEIIGHRLLWTAVLMVVVLTLLRGWRELKGIGARTWLRLSLASVLVGANWLLYVILVNAGHVTEAALGYYVNPLVNVLLGVVILHERLSRLQQLSCVIAAMAVVVLSIGAGTPPTLGLGLALSFGLYGFVKRGIRLSVPAQLSAEALILSPVALIYLLFLELKGTGTFGHISPGHTALLMLAGVVTAIPLLCYGKANTLIPYSTLGMLQYITPTIALGWAVFIVKEPMDAYRVAGFAIIWVAVGLYMGDLIRRRAHT